MLLAFKHEAASQRRHYRITAPITVSINGNDYTAVNWSVSGFKIEGVGAPPIIDSIETIQVIIPFQGFDVRFNSTARLKRYEPETGGLAGEFIELGEREKTLLETFIQGISSGDMQEIGGVIKRLDRPVTPAALKPDSKTLISPALAEAKRQKGIMLYSIAGAILALILGLVIYTNFFQIKVTTAVVMGQNDVIISPTVGSIIYTAPLNEELNNGDVIMSIADQKLEYDIKLAELRVQDAEIEAKRLDATLELEKQRLQAASGIVSKEWQASSQTVNSLRKNLEVKQASLKRIQELEKQGVASQIMLDKVRSEYLDTERDLNEARQAEAKLAQELSTVKGGFQVRDQSVQAGIQDMEELRKAAVEKLAIARTEYDFLQANKARLNITAQADGKLVRIFTPQNSATKYGDPIAVFERKGQKLIKAFVTQEEALQISMGKKAKVYFPYNWVSTPYKVADIDYYSLTLNQAQGNFQWQNLQNNTFKTVIVTLEPLENNKDIQVATAGTAATVVFNKF